MTRTPSIKALRPYQSQMIETARQSLAAGHRRIVVQAPTGSGKTRVAVEIIRLARAKNRRVLFLAPRRELIFQVRDELGRHEVWAGTIMAGERPSPSLEVQVASFDTLHARCVRGRASLMPLADVVIVDECHLALAKSRREILDHYAAATIIGLTATPARGDGRGLGEVFHDLILGPSVRELTAGGFLVPARYFAPSKPDLAAVGLNKDGDYVEGQLAAAIAPLIGDIVHNWLRIARDRRTVVFCVNCDHSRSVTESFKAAGVEAEHLDGETPAGERADILERVRNGSTQVLCNVFVASYGLDIPALDCAVLARPTKNITLFMQTVGRVLRTYPGKFDALVIDHAGAIAENGFVEDFIPWSLDPTEKVKDRKTADAQEKNAPKEIECGHCHTVFRGRRDCPSCGLQIIGAGKPIPVHEADLQELAKDQRKSNREMTWEEKCSFIGQLRGYAATHGFQAGWVAHKYRTKTDVWPNDPRLKMAAARHPTPEVQAWITSQNIRHAKRRATA